jgi:predicted NBD/HSP70 family sugar kinase
VLGIIIDVAHRWIVATGLDGKLCEERSHRITTLASYKNVIGFLAIGLATVINVFNPSTLFIHGQLFDVDEKLFAQVLEQTSKRALAPWFADCRIIRARGSKL